MGSNEKENSETSEIKNLCDEAKLCERRTCGKFHLVYGRMLDIYKSSDKNSLLAAPVEPVAPPRCPVAVSFNAGAAAVALSLTLAKYVCDEMQSKYARK